MRSERPPNFAGRGRVFILWGKPAAEVIPQMSSKKALLAVVLCSLACLFTPRLHGQATGSFSGTVADKAGAVIAGATVKATSPGTGVARESKTDDSGHFEIPLLPVTSYTIRVEAQG